MTGATLDVFDTFEGHPEDAISDHDPFQQAGQFGGAGFKRVREVLSGFQSIQFYRGDVLESLPHVPESMYRFVHIDTDLYQPTLTCLEYYAARLSPGGIIVLDDYTSYKCPGVQKAAVEFLANTHEFHVWDMRTEQLMLVKAMSGPAGSSARTVDPEASA